MGLEENGFGNTYYILKITLTTKGTGSQKHVILLFCSSYVLFFVFFYPMAGHFIFAY